MMFRTSKKYALVALASVALLAAGCGSSSPNQVTVFVSPSSAVVVAGQVASFSATVNGSSTTTSKWTCSYTYNPPATTANPSPKPVTGTCTSGGSLNGGTFGTWTTTDSASPNILVYTAPTLDKFPNPIPQLTFTAAADAAPKKTGTAVIALDTGIRVGISPLSATVPVGVTPAQTAKFTASLLNAPPINLQWLVTQPNSSSTTTTNQTPNPLGATCSPTCGAIDDNGVFTAPGTLPTDTTPTGSKSTSPTTVFVVVNSKSDPNHFAVATITLISASTNPITFNGIEPTTIAAGGVVQDVFLSAKNLLNTTAVTFKAPDGSVTVLSPSTQVFTIPISPAYCTPSATGVTPVVTCDASIVTRVRLNSAQLAKAGAAQIIVNGITGDTSSLPAGCAASTVSGSTSVACNLNLVYASPAVVAAVPDSFPQNTAAIQFSTDGGYYGTGVNLLFNGGELLVPSSDARRFTGELPNSQLQNPGLYPVSIQSNAPLANPSPFNPPPFPTVTTNVAVQPNFSDVNGIYNSGTTATVFPPTVPLPANSEPSSMAVSSAHGYAVITEQAANQIQVVTLPSSGTGQPAPLTPVAVGVAPTGVAIDDQIDLSSVGFAGQDLGVVVNSGDPSLSLVALPSGATIRKLDLTGLISQSSSSTAPPVPYAVGVDPSTHRAVLAYSNTNIGFVVDISPVAHSQTCFPSSTVTTPPCVIASVSLNTGATPQVIVQPGAPLAYVTPGGSGVTSVVNLTLTNTVSHIAGSSASPAGAVRNNNVVTITTTDVNGINPALGGTVLIAGVTPVDFNGTYLVNPGSVTPFTFSYTQTGSNETGGGGTVQYGSPYYTFTTTNTAAGAAINPVTRTFAFADYNATAAQIGFIRTLDQSLSTLTLTAGSCNGCTPTPTGAPESGFRSVAWDPFNNVLVAYNPSANSGPDFPGNAISLINPGGPVANGTQNPYRIVKAISTGQTGSGSYTPAGSTTPVVVNGPMGYDPKTNLVLVANAGSSTLSYLNLNASGSFKTIEAASLKVTAGGVASGQPALGTGPAVCDPADTTGSKPCLPQGVTVGQSATIKIFGQGFGTTSGAVVRLDGSATGVTTTWVNDGEVDAVIAASRLTVPHDFAVDVLAGGAASNTLELQAVMVRDLTPACAAAPVAGSSTFLGQGPEAVAIDDIRHVAVVTNFTCGSASIINLDTTGTLYAGKVYGDILSNVTVGKQPLGVDVLPRLGYAVVANNGDGTASIINMKDPTNASLAVSTNVTVGTAPTGVAMDQDRARALIANSGSNTVSYIDLTVLTLATPKTPTAGLIPVSGPPKAIAVDPNREIAVVTNIQNAGTSTVTGGLDVINLASATPTKSTTASIGSLTANPTGIAYDPAVSPALFYVTSTQQNAVYAFNPDTSFASQVRVGINPYSIAYNYQTGTMLTLNSTSDTMSVVDTQTFTTRDTMSLTSQSQFAVAMDNLTNTAVIVDQNNNRVLMVAMPK